MVGLWTGLVDRLQRRSKLSGAAAQFTCLRLAGAAAPKAEPTPAADRAYMALPQGAFEKLEAGDVAGFDAAITESQTATQAALKREPAVAKNDYNESKQQQDTKPAVKSEPAKDAVVIEASASQSCPAQKICVDMRVA